MSRNGTGQDLLTLVSDLPQHIHMEDEQGIAEYGNSAQFSLGMMSFLSCTMG